MVVPKPNASLLVCVDHTNLNANVQGERHVLPAVDQVVAWLSDTKVLQNWMQVLQI